MAAQAVMDQLERLTPEQHAATRMIVHPPPGVDVVRVLAGAGSGKTRVVTTAVGVMQDLPNITGIVTTFTKKGQMEVDRRVKALVGGTSRVTIATLNALAMRFVQGNGGTLSRKVPEIFGHAFETGRQLDGNRKGLPIGGDALANRIAGRRRLRKGSKTEFEPIPGLEDTGFYGLSINGNPKDPDPEYRAPLTEEQSPGDYLKLLNLFRQRGWVGGEPQADIYIRVVEGDPEAIEQLRGLDVDPMTAAWKDMCLRSAGGYPHFGRFWFFYLQAKQNLRAWDFIDTLYAYWRFGTDAAQRVIVDEAQDSSWLQMQIELDIAKRGGGVVIVVGDIRQCIPAGQHVDTPQGPRLVESIRTGDVVYASVGGKAMPQVVTGVVENPGTSAWEFMLADGRTFQATDEHACFAAVGKPEGYYVYLMYREGYGFRLGSTSVTGDKSLGHLIVRTQQEQAQRLWLLSTHPTAAEAHREEHRLAYRWRVPMAPFKPRPGTMFDSGEQATAFFQEFAQNGHALLADLHLRFDRPTYIAKSTMRGCVSINLILGCGKTAGRPGVTKVEVESQLIPEAIRREFGFVATKSGCYRLRRESPDVGRITALAEMLHAALRTVGVAAHIAETLSVPTADRRVFCVPAAALVPGVQVPALDAAGEVQMLAVVARRRVTVSRVFDLAVASAGTFMVGGVVVHNSIFSFQGAMPSFMANMPLVYSTATTEITTNFRSRRQIVMLGNEVAQGHDWCVGSPSMPARREQGRLEPGRVEVVTGGAAMDTVDLLCARIQADLEVTKDPGRHAILVRTHAHADLFEMALLRLGIPIVRVGKKRTFFDQPQARKVISYLWLAANPAGGLAAGVAAGATKDDPGIMARIANGEEHRLRYISAEAFRDLGARAVAAGQTEPLAGLRWMRDHAPDNSALARGLRTYVSDVEAIHRATWPKTLDVIEGLLVPPLPDDDEDETGPADLDDDDAAADPLALMRSVIHTIKTIAEGKTLIELGRFIAQVKTAATAVIRFSGGPNDTEFANEYDNVKKSCVTLSTIHGVKGLEYPNVTVLVQEGSFPMWRADPDEERRLYYVAVTRAENDLTIGVVTERDDGRPLPWPDTAIVTANFLQRDQNEAYLLNRGVALGWQSGDTQVQLAERVITWSHPTQALQMRFDLTALRLDRIDEGQPTVALTHLEGVPWSEYLEQVLGVLESTLAGDQPPAVIEAPRPVTPEQVVITTESYLTPLGQQRRAAFHPWLSDRGLGEYHDLADEIIDYDQPPPLTNAQISSRLGWSSVNDLERVVQAASPIDLAGDTVVVAKHAGGVTAIWRGPAGMQFSGATPVDLGNPQTRWGVSNQQRSEVTWLSGGRATLPVDAEVIGNLDPRLPGLRWAALRFAPEVAAPLTAAAVTVGPWRVGEHPKGSGLYRLMRGDEIVGTAPRAAVLVAEAYQRLTASETPTFDIPRAPGKYTVYAVMQGQPERHDVVAHSAPEAIAAILREPRWAPLVVGAGGWLSGPDPTWGYTDPTGNLYGCAAAPTEPLPAAEVPTTTPGAAVPPETPPGAARAAVTVTIPDNAYLVAAFPLNAPITERIWQREKLQVRVGSLIMLVRGNAREVLRVESGPAGGSLKAALYYSPPPAARGITTIQAANQEFYSKLREALRAGRVGDPLHAYLEANPLTPDVEAVLWALWELAPTGFEVSATGGLKAASGLVIPKASFVVHLPALVDKGLLSVVGGSGSYRWEIG